MKTLFVFSIKYLKYNNTYYTTADLQYEKLKEYLEYFGNLKAFTRCIEVDELDLNKVKIVSGKGVKFSSIFTSGVLQLLTINTYRQLYNDIKNSDFVIIRLGILGSIAYRIAKKTNKPYLIEVVGCPWDSLWNYGNIKGKIMAPIMYFTTKNIIKKAKYVHYVSESFLQSRYPTNGASLACSDVIINNLNVEVLKNRIRKIEGKKGSKYIFGIVGSLNVNYKGHEVAIKALSLLKNKIDFELHCLGTGNKNRWYKLAKKYKIENRVFFNGSLPSGQPVLEWLDSIDIHLIISKQEGLPRALVEAMSRASISIGSNVGGIPELIGKECIVDKNDYIGLAKKIEEILNDTELQIQIAKKNFNRANDFEKTKLDEKRRLFYNSILNKENVINE